MGRARRRSACRSRTWAPRADSGVPWRGGLRFVRVLTGLRHFDGDTIASRPAVGDRPSPRHRPGGSARPCLGLGLANRGGPDGDRLGTLGRRADLLVAVRGDDQGGGRDARLAVLHRTDPLGHALVQFLPVGLDGRAADLERPRRFLLRNCLFSSSFRPTAPGQAGQPGRRHRPPALGRDRGVAGLPDATGAGGGLAGVPGASLCP